MLFKTTTSADAAVSLAAFTDVMLMVPELHERDTAGVIKELSELLQRNGHLPDVLPFYHAALNREFLVSTATDYGMAFPHARVSGLDRLRFALGRSAEPFPWGGKTAKPVQFVFLVAVPATDAAGYLHLLSGLAKLAKENPLMHALRHAPDAHAMLGLLREVKLRHG